MNKHLSIFNQLRPVTVGFDNIFDHFESMFDNDVFTIPQVNYPPYNIVKTGSNTYDIEVALAGFSKDDIEVEAEGNRLSIRSSNTEESSEKQNENYVHRGIAKRSFMRQFNLSDDIIVKSADLKDGMLTVSLEREIPEEKKPRLIPIGQ